MASIHEVAKMAGVSTATVSKFINSSGYISPSKRAAIESAIEKLNYVPNRSARQLKTSSSREVLYIVPNMTEKIYREIFNSLDTSITSEYRVILRTTNDNVSREEEILRECLNNPCAGVFLCTCNPQNTDLFDKIIRRTPLFFILRRPRNAHNYNCIGFDHADAIYALTTELIEQGYDDIGLYAGNAAFSNEAECVESFQAAFAYKELEIRKNRIFSFSYSKEAVFRSIMNLFDSGDYPKVFITTSYICAQAINEVAYFRDMELGRDLLLFTLGEDSWYNSMFVNKIICTYRDARKLGAVAAASWNSYIQAPNVFETVDIKLQDGFDHRRVGNYISRLQASAPLRRPISVKNKLRLAFNSMDSGTDALKSLIPQFVKEYGIDVEICLMGYDDLYKTLCQEAENPGCRYDLFSVDVPWMPHLHQLGLMHDLTDRFVRSNLPAQFAPYVLERISSFNGRILGLPYLYTLSLLYYRKDHFADPELQQLFYNTYRVPLEPPRTWHMFNLIASFFTRERNPASPTQYGTGTFCGGFATPMCTELYPRIWSYGGTIFDKYGFVRLYSYENYKACLSLAESIRCSPPETLTSDIYEGLQQLLDGQTAMQINFSNNASIIADFSRNEVRDKIGFQAIPNRKPVLAGWNICINRKTPIIEQAYNFVQWFSSLEISSAYMTLGGVSPITTLLEHEPFLQLYPWTALAREEYTTSIARVVPSLPGTPILQEEIVEAVISSVMFDYCTGKDELEPLLFRAHCKLCEYAESNGYPKNVIPQRLHF